jgi:predicted nucleic acid-binding protein
MVVIDTSVWIDYFNGNENEKTKILEYIMESDRQIIMPGIIYVEILQGIRTDKMYDEIKESLDEFIFEYYDDKNIYLKAVEIYRTCRKKGITIRKTIDCLIAAIVLERNFDFLHNDKDFDSIAEFFDMNFL